MSKILIGIIFFNLFFYIICMDLSPPRIRTSTCRHFKTEHDCLTPRFIGPKSNGNWCQWTKTFGYETCEYDPDSIEDHFCRPKSKENCKFGQCRGAPLNCLSRVTQGSCEKTLAYSRTYCRWYNVSKLNEKFY
ncbi:hypothetical protein Mgra_00005908 [Meloidogyne graminicola]|uniref:Uncharacterized protein n=1 Tax=Meloidogyne graminicola TaxID=189291 RepID=A0A8S9ZMJ0_9BILA|nr:hypothetical protein Mgra_00005908 [Meloidogyne graminicola]